MLYNRIRKVLSAAGSFEALFCIGDFFGENGDEFEKLTENFSESIFFILVLYFSSYYDLFALPSNAFITSFHIWPEWLWTVPFDQISRYFFCLCLFDTLKDSKEPLQRYQGSALSMLVSVPASKRIPTPGSQNFPPLRLILLLME